MKLLNKEESSVIQVVYDKAKVEMPIKNQVKEVVKIIEVI